VDTDTEYYRRLRAKFLSGVALAQVLDHSQAMIIVVDARHRMVHGTQAILDLAGATGMDDLLGRAPGDFFRCVNSLEAGCGKGRNCCECGAFLGIRSTLAGKEADAECYLTFHTGDRLEARDFHVRGLPLQFEDQPYAILSFEDVGHEKRRRALERVFLHDLLNSVGAIKGLLHFLQGELTGENQDLVRTVLPYFDICVDEIAAQRKLLAAETNELVLSCDRFSLTQLLRGLTHVYAQHALGSDKTIEVNVRCADDEMVGDRVIVHRICMNLLKNALEATGPGQAVRLEADRDGDDILISVRNPGRMPDAVQRQLFRRSFSTKGEGRGLGTYSVHLLCTNYLGGRVWFESTEEGGTVFHVRIPANSSGAVRALGELRKRAADSSITA
jgi:signal transduction histidine kinase